MWEFLKSKKGELNFEALGAKIYVNADSVQDNNPTLTKSVRKLVRAIIEKNGLTPGKTKKELLKGTSYYTGRVYWKGVRMAEWDWGTESLTLTDAGREHEYAFNKLMGLAQG